MTELMQILIGSTTDEKKFAKKKNKEVQTVQQVSFSRTFGTDTLFWYYLHTYDSFAHNQNKEKNIISIFFTSFCNVT